MDARAKTKPGQPAAGPAKRSGAFVVVPLKGMAAAAKATNSPQAFVYVWLLYLAWKTRSRTFPLPNGALAAYGIDRFSKIRALAGLEAAGLITVNRRSRKTPIVTLDGRFAEGKSVAD